MRYFLTILLCFLTVECYGAEALIAVRNSQWQEGHCQDGAIVDIRPDGFEWGRKEKQKFLIIKVPDSMLEKREEARQPFSNGRVKYIYEYWNELDKVVVDKIKTKTEDNVYIKTEHCLNDMLEKDADNNTVGDLFIVSP